MEQHTIQQPLLSGGVNGAQSGRWSSYEYLGSTPSALIPNASMGVGAELTVDEIRSVASNSEHHYPPSLHAPLISSPDSYSYAGELALDQRTGYGGDLGGDANMFQRQVLDEIEIRELLMDHVGHRCCWGSRPARTWKIQMVEDCNVYIGTLDTFTEEREVITERIPYQGVNIDGKDSGPEPGIWELDLRSQFPVLFTPQKETRMKVPHSETIEKCPGCDGRGDTVCPTCNANQEPGFYKENQMTPCTSCFGRGLIAHRDGSDTICTQCNGKGKIPCATCSSSGLIKCNICRGSGSILARNIAIVKWKTLSTRKVSATRGAASVPDDVFHRAKGVQLCNMQAYQCTPAFFADSYFLNTFSSEVIADRTPVPPTARVICERHTISVVPVTRITMSHSSRSFSFYIIGFSREVYLKDRYPAQFCWGLCPCLEWLNL
ncbi:uncharacterized protein LOC130798294 [Amaranthus tricolor]|uniref:uncharacterized protein LOC130798294 n=1 Tax=Amaranthus tricolor TaxID=29722 RepID=UPI00258335C8|nr:uncharacterized protein LOC130798294 [Amaranthus tricolor]XP_057517204.1 uncharacterized protein LOC130798294 [Amaranthus tricolor]XP_057517205.1 uncharacterized protein LOC130798294 [Amaranthus tricolor]XP_057517206.1 uncharacterized protein LOC130798294 [Amaranthus tricolor]